MTKSTENREWVQQELPLDYSGADNWEMENKVSMTNSSIEEFNKMVKQHNIESSRRILSRLFNIEIEEKEKLYNEYPPIEGTDI